MKRWLLIFVALVFSHGLFGVASEVHPKNPFFAGILKLDFKIALSRKLALTQMKVIQAQRQQAEERKRLEIEKEEREYQSAEAYLKRAVFVRDMLLGDYYQGTLPRISTIPHAEIQEITIGIAVEGSQNPVYVYKKDDESYEQYEARKKQYIENEYLRYKIESFWGNRSRLAGKVFRGFKSDRPVVILNNDCVDKDEKHVGTEIVYHELAHAFDKCMSTKNAECYSWLEEDIKQYNLKDTLRHELHADKQAIKWIKKYNPDHAKKLEDLYEELLHTGREWPGLKDGYAPARVKLAWLRDPNV